MLVATAVVLSLWVSFVAQLGVTFPYTPERIVLGGDAEAAEGVVILEGPGNRIDKALDLVEGGYTNLIIQPGAGAWSERELARRGRQRGLSYGLVVTRGAKSTFEEARNASAILGDFPAIGRVLLVTSDYHSYRAYWIFRRVLPNTVRIISVPASSGYDPLLVGSDEWQRRVFRTEQLKFLSYYLRYGWRWLGFR